MTTSWFERLFPDRPPPELGDFTATRRMLPITAIAVVIGGLAGFIALGLLKLINLMTNLFYFQRLSTAWVSPADHHLGPLAIFAPVIGALIIGVMARYGSEKIRGHGIPEALESIMINGSRVGGRVALLKPISAAISIGSGGPFGAEGPIIMTGGAFGSLVAQGFHLTSAERKTLLVAGAAAGMTATFGSPIAAMFLAVELLLFEWKPRSFVPVALACATAMATRQFLMTGGALFEVPHHAEVFSAAVLLACAACGLGAGMLSAVMTGSVFFFEDLFAEHLKAIHWMWWPAIAGVVIGAGGLICPQALGVGYDSIGALLAGNLALRATLILMAVKLSIWSVSLGSGTSGGVLAPLLMLGAALGTLESQILPDVGPGFWALVSMGAILGGTMRAPFTGMLFAVEITHDWSALLPLAIACSVAHAFTVLTLRRSILTEKVARRGYHVTREYAIDPLEVLFVREVMHENVLGAPHAPIVLSDDTLRTATHFMADRGVTRLCVADREDPTKPIGVITLEDTLAARRRHIEDETRRDRTLTIQRLVPWRGLR